MHLSCIIENKLQTLRLRLLKKIFVNLINIYVIDDKQIC